ncbi:phosphatase PAP2 family protein [Paenibacillus sp. PvR052]
MLYVSLFIVGWGLFAIVFAYTDLEISKALVDPRSGWAYFFEAFGEHPALFFVFIGANVLCQTARIYSPAIRFVLRGFSVAAAILAGYLIAYLTAHRWMEMELSFFSSLTILLIVSLIAAVIQLLLRQVPHQILLKHHKAVWVTLALIACELLLVHTLKLSWGRIRFRDLLPDYSNFMAWYAPQGAEGHRSFPSGHAANGWVMLSLLFFVPLHQKRWRAAVLTFAIAWGVLTAYSRIVIGAHYASDVLFGSCLTLSLFYILHRWLYSPSQQNKPA